MPKDGGATRDKILDGAQALILEFGYAGMSVDRLVETAGITKGAFFYHFKSKSDLAKALIHRFRDDDLDIMETFTTRAKNLSRDPLQQILIFMGLFEDMFESMETVHSGCLFASYTHELQQFDEETHQIIMESFIEWRKHLGSWFGAIAEQYPPRIPVDIDSLADELTVILEGAFVTAKVLKDRTVIPNQLRHYRNYLELLFMPTSQQPAGQESFS
jgi:TetR/AcrR family transcriptional repressor of nem operon